MATKQHQFDTVAETLAEWVTSITRECVDALTEGDVAPFAANVTNAQKLAYYSSKVYLPDGSINVPGRNELMATYGPEGYAQIMRTVLKSMGGLPPIPTTFTDMSPPSAPIPGGLV